MIIAIGILTVISFYLSVKWIKSEKFELEPKIVLLSSILSLLAYFSSLILPDNLNAIFNAQDRNSELIKELDSKYQDLELFQENWSIIGFHQSNLSSLRRCQTNAHIFLDLEDADLSIQTLKLSHKALYPEVFISNVRNPLFVKSVGECALMDYENFADSIKYYNDLILEYATRDQHRSLRVINALRMYSMYLSICSSMNDFHLKDANEETIKSFECESFELN